jgi:hypothetical protein
VIEMEIKIMKRGKKGGVLMKIETVCGSIKFSREMMKYRDEQLSNGNWVLIPENMELDAQMNDTIKAKMDILHKSKIDVADTVLIWNRNGYIGKSTRSELDYAQRNNKPITFLEDPTDKKEVKSYAKEGLYY